LAEFPLKRLDNDAVSFQPFLVSDTLYPIARSLLFRLDPEQAHHWSMALLRRTEQCGLLRMAMRPPEAKTPIEVMGLQFPNRVGLAAGLDKRGQHH
jgi:dihydroorotate dehydrogenase